MSDVIRSERLFAFYSVLESVEMWWSESDGANLTEHLVLSTFYHPPFDMEEFEASGSNISSNTRVILATGRNIRDFICAGFGGNTWG